MPASLSICNYISLAFDCFANLELFAALQMLSNCLSVCVCQCVCLCVCLPFSYMFWIDLIWLIRFVFLCQSTPNYWPFGTLTLLFHSKTNQRRSTASVRLCKCVCSCLPLIRVPFFFSYMRKVFKAFASEYFFVPFTIVCWMFIELAIALRDCVFCTNPFFSSPTHTNWIINTPTFCIFAMWNSFPKSNTNAARATATEKFN